MVRLLIILLFLSIESVIGQNCNSLGFLKKGAEVELTSYDHKGKIVSVGKSKVLEVVSTADNLEAKAETKSFNEKGKELFGGNVSVLCNGSRVSFSMKNMIAGDQMANMKNMEMKVDETMLDYPNNISVGSSLKDGSFKAEMFSGGMKLMTMNFNITNRKVIGQESLTTPAGTFNCYKISYSGNMKTIVSMSFEVVEWYSPTIGLVKSETTRNGKSMGYTQLTKAIVN
ncbi:MAG: hypothetical protein V4683_07030 [Bacteroidota bacterium]